MSEERKTRIKTIINKVIIGVSILIIIGILSLIGNKIISVFEFESNYKKERIERVNKEIKYDEQIKQLRLDYKDGLDKHNFLFQEYISNNKKNSAEHASLIKEINSIKWVINRNNKEMKKDFEIIKNMNNWNKLVYIPDTNNVVINQN